MGGGGGRGAFYQACVSAAPVMLLGVAGALEGLLHA